VPASALHILDASRPAERNAVGYLHANCGTMCHKPGGGAPFSMRVTFDNTAKTMPADVSQTDVFMQAINQTSIFRPSMGPDLGAAHLYRIRPTDDTRSMIYYRTGTRTGLFGLGDQMPPIDTHSVDTVGHALLDAWITSMTAAPYPTPAAL
jgi:hypothetical protein